MSYGFSKSPIALAVAAALGTTTMIAAPKAADADERLGQYVAGDFHNHSTCSDGSTSLQKKIDKSFNTPWGLDWFVQAGHGGSGNRDCTLVEDESLATPAYPFRSGPTPFDVPTTNPPNPSPSQYMGPQTRWSQSIGNAAIKGNVGTAAVRNMWRWQSIQEFQYPLVEYLAALQHLPAFMGLESVGPGHEHISMSVITGQMPAALDDAPLPTSPGYMPLGTATALAQWEYCFDRGDTDTSRGNATVGTEPVPGGNNWNCSVTGSANELDPSWNATAQKLIPAGGTGTGSRGHAKTLEALKWMKEFHANGSYYVPAHLERAGPFNPNGNNGFNIEHLRNFNNVAPDIAFGFESQPGHGASDNRGEYRPNRNNIGGVPTDSVGGTTWGGTGVYAAQIGGVWDALLGEGRGWWFFGSSDWHGRGSFGSEDRRSTGDFWPGEYQRNYTMVRSGPRHGYTPQEIVDGLRTGNTWVDSGQLVDRFAFIACAVPPEVARRTGPLAEAIGNALVETLATVAAWANTDDGAIDCATMGQKLNVRPGSDIIVSVVVRDPSGYSYAPYTFDNPSLVQVGIHQPLNKPVLDHIDVIRGMVTGFRDPADAANYAGEWPRTWYVNPDMSTVPPAARNDSAAVLRTFNASSWRTAAGAREFKKMTFRLRDVRASQYVRLRGTNLPASVPFETDADGDPLTDAFTNANNDEPAARRLSIPCTTVGTNVPPTGTVHSTPDIDGCPEHLPANPNGGRWSAHDVAAWADVWVYGNPIFVEVQGSSPVAGVK
jgi:hypothetical protein